MQSKATTVQKYLAELPADRRAALMAVRDVIKKNLDADYEETMGYGMISYVVPHRVYPAGYHCDPKQPLPFTCLASQKNHMAVYLMSLYTDSAEEKAFRAAWAKTGKKLDMGKSCIRFKKADDLALDVLGATIRRVPAKKYIAIYEGILARGSKKAGAKSSDGKTGAAKAKGTTKATGKPQKSRSASR